MADAKGVGVVLWWTLRIRLLRLVSSKPARLLMVNCSVPAESKRMFERGASNTGSGWRRPLVDAGGGVLGL